MYMEVQGCILVYMGASEGIWLYMGIIHGAFRYISSYIDQHNGGVASLLKFEFLNRFRSVISPRDWLVIVPGRIARLCLHGSAGLCGLSGPFFYAGTN